MGLLYASWLAPRCTIDTFATMQWCCRFVIGSRVALSQCLLRTIVLQLLLEELLLEKKVHISIGASII